MARSDRLLRLLQAMRAMAPPLTAARLARETGVSLSGPTGCWTRGRRGPDSDPGARRC